jgi:hypothetical protein
MFGNGEAQHMRVKGLGLFAMHDSMTILAPFSLLACLD